MPCFHCSQGPLHYSELRVYREIWMRYFRGCCQQVVTINSIKTQALKVRTVLIEDTEVSNPPMRVDML